MDFDICRVCRAGEEEGVLFNPCGCTGSIRFVHEGCLVEWLDKSKKNKCELCNKVILFTKVYAKSMPDHLPFFLLVKRFIQSIFSALFFGFRAIFVATTWLVILPYETFWIMRGLLFTDSALSNLSSVMSGNKKHSLYAGELIEILANTTTIVDELKTQLLNQVVELPGKWTMNDKKSLLLGILDKVNNGTITNSTELLKAGHFSVGNLSSMVNSETLFGGVDAQSWRRLFNVFAQDVFSGQIIASSVVVVFVIGFLLREWIVLNAPFHAPVQAPPPPPPPPIEIRNQIALFNTFQYDAPLEEDQHTWRSVDENEDQDEWEEDEDEEEEDEEGDDPYGREERNDDSEQEEEEETGEAWGDGFDSGGWNNHIKASEAVASTSTSSAQVNSNNLIPTSSPLPTISHQKKETNFVEREIKSNGRLRSSNNTSPPRIIPDLPTPSTSTARSNETNAEPVPPFRFDFQFDVPPHLNFDLQPEPHPQPQVDLPEYLPPAPVLQRVVPIPLLVPPPIVPGNPFEGVMGIDNEEEVDILEDFEGVLDAVGMNSFLVLFQNMGLMNLLIGLCLVVALWVPLIIGRLLAVFNAIRLITIPLSAVRSLSDPIFDFIFGSIAFVVKTIYSSTILQLLPSKVTSKVLSETVTLSSTKGVSVIIKSVFIGIATGWSKMSYAEDTLHRSLCVALGYSFVLLVGVIYLNSTNTEVGEAVNRAIREGIKQQLTLMKVCIFVFVELIIFPTTCGLFLNLATLPVFPGASIATRIAFHNRSPVSALLITWLIGTIFMFCFSIAIDGIRDCARPGTLWFIRDPASADFHPIREILERKSATQAKKIATSAVLYASVIFATFGLSILFLKYACVGILPLRWNYERTLSLPIDLIVFRFVIPYAIKITDFRSILKTNFLKWSKFTAHQLRLTSFMFGGPRDPYEEITNIRKTWKAFFTLKTVDLRSSVEDPEVSCRPDGGFGRVPAVDGCKVVPGRKMLIRCDEAGRPLDNEGLTIVYAQVHEMRTSRPKDKYETVYLPPNFKTRLICFVYSLFFSGTLAGMTCILIPLLGGRYVFTFFTKSQVHDIYSFVVGSFILGGVVLAIRLVISLQNYRPQLKHIKPLFHTISAVLTALFLLPILSSTFLSLYILLPLSKFFPQLFPVLTTTADHSGFTSIPIMFASTNGQPTFFIFPSFTTGCVLVNVLYHLFCLSTTVRNPIRVQLAFFWFTYENVSWTIAATMINEHLLWPLLWKLTLIVGLPGLTGYSYELWKGVEVGREVVDLVGIWRIAYTNAAILGVITSVYFGGKTSIEKWIRRLREEEYLVEKKLRNYGETEEEVEESKDKEGLTMADIFVQTFD